MPVIKFENEIVDLLLSPNAQDEFKHWKLKILLIDIADKVYIDQIEDVVQILHKCIHELEQLGRFKVQHVILSIFINHYFIFH